MQQYRQHGFMVGQDEIDMLDKVARVLRTSRSRALRLVCAFYAEHPEGMNMLARPREAPAPVEAPHDTHDTHDAPCS